MEQTTPNFDAYIISSVSDFDILKRNIPYIKKNIPAKHIFIVAKEQPSDDILNGCIFLDENNITEGLTFKAVSEKIQELGGNTKHTGWYFQQFIKLALSKISKNQYYLVWDCDTIPLHNLDFFDKNNHPYFNLKREYKPRYFSTIKQLLGLKKKIKPSFISEHMMFDSELTNELIKLIEQKKIIGNTFWEKIITVSFRRTSESERNFSEFETYGTFVESFYKDRYSKRKLQTLRYGTEFFGERPEENILRWCAKKLDTISFEKYDYSRPILSQKLTDEYIRNNSVKSFLRKLQKYDNRMLLKSILFFNRKKYKICRKNNIIYEMDYIFSKKNSFSFFSALLYKFKYLNQSSDKSKTHNIQKSIHTQTSFSYSVSIIIVNYNTRDLLKDCLKSIYEHTMDIDFEVIVSDNGSSDGSIEMLKTEFPQVILIENNANLGFGAANNRGLEIAKGKYIFYLNSDTILLNNAVKIFFDYFEHNNIDKKLGAIGANLLDEKDVIIHSAGTFRSINTELKDAVHDMIRSYKLIIPVLKNKKMGKEPPSCEKLIGKVDYVTGADLFVKNDIFARFDEQYFLYYEENDMQRTMSLNGKDRIIIDGPLIRHLKGGSNTASNPLKFYKSVSKINTFISCCKYQKKFNKNPIKLFILKCIITLHWLNPELIKNNGKYLKKLWCI